MLVLVAMLIVVFLITVVFSVDVAYMQLVNTQLRTATDAAAKAAVEFALTAFLLFLLFVAALEFSRMNMVRHTMDIVDYEGTRNPAENRVTVCTSTRLHGRKLSTAKRDRFSAIHARCRD